MFCHTRSCQTDNTYEHSYELLRSMKLQSRVEAYLFPARRIDICYNRIVRVIVPCGFVNDRGDESRSGI